MWFPIVVVVAIVSMSVMVVWPRREDQAGSGGHGRGKADRLAAPDGPVQPVSLEGVLCAQLADGEISRRQYLRAMEQLAARDDERHPLAVPPEISGGA